jgi:hypothetical protein
MEQIKTFFQLGQNAGRNITENKQGQR